VPPAVRNGLGLSADEDATIAAIFATYNRGNGLNLIALSAVLDSGDPAAAFALSLEAVPTHEAASELPALLSLDELPPHVGTLILELNAMGTAGSAAPIVASLYRHHGYWPSYLALAWAQLGPLDASGRLAAAIDDVRSAGEAEAGRIASHRGAAPSTIDSEDIEFARKAIRYFRDTAICRMVTIGLVLTRSFADSS